MLGWLHYKILQSTNFWKECKEPEWLSGIRSRSSFPRLYGTTRYFKGRTFRYKVVGQPNFTHGYDPTKCYRKYRNHILKKKAGLI